MAWFSDAATTVNVSCVVEILSVCQIYLFRKGFSSAAAVKLARTGRKPTWRTLQADMSQVAC